VIQPFAHYLRKRVMAWPQLTGARLLRWSVRNLGVSARAPLSSSFLSRKRM
jgi:hypothetical protein